MDTLEQSSERKSAKEQETFWAKAISWPGRFAVLLAVVVSPWLIASVESAPQLFITICMLTGMAFWWFDTASNRRNKQILPYVFFPVFAGLLIGLIQVTPLPEFAQGILLNRQSDLYERYSIDGAILVDGDEASIANSVAKYVSLDRDYTWHQIRLLLIAIAALLLGCRYFRKKEDIKILFTVITVNGVALTFFGLVQKLTYNNKLYWVYELTVGGSPFGPFVNRNNAAGYLLMCLAAGIGLMVLLWTDRPKNTGPQTIFSKEVPFWRRLWQQFLELISEMSASKLSIVLGVMIIAAGIISSLSRGGAVAFLVAVVFTFLSYGMARKPRNAGLLLIAGVVVIGGLTTWLGFSDQLIDRFEKTESQVQEFVDSDARIKTWKDTWPAVSEMGLLGSGLGSYRSVHRIYRTDLESTIYRYAENQYFQSLVEGGWGALLLFLLACYLAFHYSFLLLYRGQSATSVCVGTMGVFLVTSQAVHSCVDFGFYIPANMLLMAVLVGFLASQAHSFARRLKSKSFLRFDFSNKTTQGVILLLFGGLTITSLALYRHSALDASMGNDPAREEYQTSLEEIDKHIDKLTPAVAKTKSARGWNRLASLWIQRARLMYWKQLANDPAIKLMAGQQKLEMHNKLWQLTSLSRIHEQVNFLNTKVSQFEASQFLKSPFLAENLPIARQYYSMSRSASPLQPHAHVRIGKLNALIGDMEIARIDLERAIELSPSNPSLRLSAGNFYLQTGQVDQSLPHFQKYLELLPSNFDPLIQLMIGRADRGIPPVPPEKIVGSVISTNPGLMFRFAMDYVSKEDVLFREIMSSTDQLLKDVVPAEHDAYRLGADVKLALGQTEEAIDMLHVLLVSNPADLGLRYKLATLQLAEGMFADAEKNAEYLQRANSRNKNYEFLAEQIKKAISSSNFNN